MVEPGPSDDEVTRTLSQESYSHSKGVTSLGVSRYDGAQLASNNPCEDRYVHGKFLADWGSQCMAWGVFDGHGGGETAELLKKQLLSFVRHRLSPGWIPRGREPNPERSHTGLCGSGGLDRQNGPGTSTER